MNLKNIFTLLAAGLVLLSCDKYKGLPDGMYASIRPEKGEEILVKLYYKEVPMTVGNFVALAEGTMQGDISPVYKGRKFYDSLVFHRVEPDFVVQTGDPSGTGYEGPGYEFPVEIVDSLHHVPGVVAMANTSPLTNGSQFYITMGASPWLDGQYTVFGRLADPDKGLGNVKAIQKGDRIKEVKIIRKGAEAESWDAYKAFEENRPKVEQAFKARVQASVDSMFKDAQVTPSGLKIKILEKGNGRLYKKGEDATVHYTGKFEYGRVFDSSKISGRPITFPLGQGQVIEGWDEAVAMLPIGTKALVFIPSKLGYGNRQVGPIPAESNLIFEMEILEPAK